MTQIGILSGIYGKKSADVTRSYPVNLTPVGEAQGGEGTGISNGYLRLAFGVEAKSATMKADRGGYNWSGRHVRALGDGLYDVPSSGATTRIADLAGTEPVTFAESFDRLAIAAGGKLYYLQGQALTQVTDPDLGTALSLAWSDGYFLTTDGTSIVATELADPTSVDPLKYGSSEADPDPVIGLLALRGTVYALNRYSIEAFTNSGSTGFPFRRNRGSQIPKGCVGAQAFTPFVETFAFVGSARNEQAGLYLAGAGQAIPIAPRVVADELAGLTEEQLAAIELEALNAGGQLQLLVHLPARTWVYHWTVSQAFDVPVWSILAGGDTAEAAYPARHFTFAGGDWWCGGQGKIGVVSDAVTLFDQPMGYRFDTGFVYNGSAGAIIDELELVALTGRGEAEASIALSHTDDGVVYSQERWKSLGGRGERGKRPAWRRCGRIAHWRGFRFRGIAVAPVSFMRLEAQIEALNA